MHHYGDCTEIYPWSEGCGLPWSVTSSSSAETTERSAVSATPLTFMAAGTTLSECEVN